MLAEREAREPRLETDRLLLRRWRTGDLGELAAINADACVMAHFPALLDAGQSAALVQRIERCFRERGYGLFAVEARAQGRLIGFVGLSPVGGSLPFAPAVEIGWRLARPCWGRGLAHEAAEAVLAFAFVQARLPALVSFTTQGNARSRRLMERLGMRRDPAEDFIHPELRGHPLAPHVLYRLRAEEWRLRG